MAEKLKVGVTIVTRLVGDALKQTQYGLTATSRSAVKVGGAVQGMDRRVGSAVQGLRRADRTTAALGRTMRTTDRTTAAVGRTMRTAGQRAGDLGRDARRGAQGVRAIGDAARATERTVDGAMRRTRAALQQTREVAGRTWGGGGGVGGVIGGAITGAAGVSAARREVAQREWWTRLAVEADLSADTVAAHRAAVAETAHGLGLTTRRLGDALASVTERTGDYSGAYAARVEIGRLIQRTGGDGRAIGETLAASRLLGIKSGADIDRAGMIGVGAQRVGAMTLADVAAAGTPAIAAWAATGQEGVGAWQELMATLQVGMQATGSRDLAVGSVVAYLADLKSLTADLAALGVETQDRTPLQIAESVAAAGGEAEKLFGRESGRLIAQLGLDTGRRLVADVRALAPDPALYQAEIDRLASTTSARMAVVADRAAERAGGIMGGLIDRAGAEVAHYVGAALDAAPALIGGVLGIKALRRIGGALRRPRPAAAAPGAAVQPAAARVPARVPGAAVEGGLLRRIGAAMRPAAAAPGAAVQPAAARVPARVPGAAVEGGLLRRIGAAMRPAAAAPAPGAGGILRRGARRIPWIGAALGAAHVGAVARTGDRRATASAMGDVLGGAGGAAIGAAIGTVILPGIGTVIGGLLGGIAGGIAGGKAGGAVADARERRLGVGVEATPALGAALSAVEAWQRRGA